MALWIPFAFGGFLGALLGFLIGGQRPTQHRSSVSMRDPPTFLML
jgi:hypothetical protein